jgi:hypothetical protein
MRVGGQASPRIRALASEPCWAQTGLRCKDGLTVRLQRCHCAACQRCASKLKCCAAHQTLLRKLDVRSQVGKEHAAIASHAATIEAAEAAEARGRERLEAVLAREGKGAMWEAQQAARALRAVPLIDLDTPTVRCSLATRDACCDSPKIAPGCSAILQGK